MKKLLSTLLIIIPIFLFAKEIKNVNNLEQNDILKLRLTFPRNTINLNVEPWSIEQKEQIDVEIKVINQNKESIEFAILPTHWFIYYQSPHNRDVNVYFDSDFLIFSDNNPIFNLFENNSVTANLNKENNNISINFKTIQGEEDKNSSRKEWVTQLIEIPKGLKIAPFDNEFPMNKLNFEKVINFSLSELFNQLKKTHQLPWIIINKENKDKELPYFIEIIDASFNLKANTTVVVNPSTKTPIEDIWIKLGDKKITPTKQNRDSFIFEFFLPSPQRAYLKDYILDLTPTDSLLIAYSKIDKNYIIKGKGAANSNYINAIRKFYDTTLNNYHSNLNETLEKGEDIYASSLKNTKAK